MLEQIVNNLGGRELQAKSDLTPTETGVTISSADQLRVYGFPDGLKASRFMEEATTQTVMTTGKMAIGNIFEPPKRPWWKVRQSS